VALIRRPRRRSIGSSAAKTIGQSRGRTATIRPRGTCPAAKQDQASRLRTRWELVKCRSWLRPMIRRAEPTVRRPVARIAPTARTWALAQARSENKGAKAASRAMISGGRSTGVVSRVDGSSTTIDPGR
jgi:hypothetical protein